MTAKEIVIEHIQKHGLSDSYSYEDMVNEWLFDNKLDGLYCDECGCEKNDLAPCGDPMDDCKAGHKTRCIPESCPASGDCDWHIGPEKEIEDEA